MNTSDALWLLFVCVILIAIGKSTAELRKGLKKRPTKEFILRDVQLAEQEPFMLACLAAFIEALQYSDHIIHEEDLGYSKEVVIACLEKKFELVENNPTDYNFTEPEAIAYVDTINVCIMQANRIQ